MEQENIESIVKHLEEELLSIKSRQTTNHKSIVSKKTWSSDQYDVYVRMTARDQYYRLTVNSSSGNISAVSMKYFYRWNNPDVMASPYYPQPTAPEVNILMLQQAPSVGTNIYDFRINLPLSGFPPPADVYIKFLFDGTDTFTYTWQQI